MYLFIESLNMIYLTGIGMYNCVYIAKLSWHSAGPGAGAGNQNKGKPIATGGVPLASVRYSVAEPSARVGLAGQASTRRPRACLAHAAPRSLLMVPIDNSPESSSPLSSAPCLSKYNIPL